MKIIFWWAYILDITCLTITHHTSIERYFKYCTFRSKLKLQQNLIQYHWTHLIFFYLLSNEMEKDLQGLIYALFHFHFSLSKTIITKNINVRYSIIFQISCNFLISIYNLRVKTSSTFISNQLIYSETYILVAHKS